MANRNLTITTPCSTVFNITTKNGKVNQYYGKFVHEGTQERVAKKGKVFVFTNEHGDKVFTRRAAAMKTNPYIQRAYDGNVEGSIQRFGNDLGESVDKFVAQKFKPVTP
jgi:environmental stress-induced protein Ves